MNREQAEQVASEHLAEYLTNEMQIDITRAFTCINPAHTDKHPSMHYHTKGKKPYCKCMSCGANYDLFEVIKIHKGLDIGSSIQYALNIYSLNADNTPLKADIKPRQSQEQHQEQYTIDLTSEMQTAQAELLKNADALRHFTDRGLTIAEIKKFNLGYVPGGYNELMQKHPKHHTKNINAEKYKYCIPLTDQAGKCSYIVTEPINRTEQALAKMKYKRIDSYNTGLVCPYMNEHYIQDAPAQYIYLVEGYYDAMSLECLNFRAIGGIGTSNNRLIELFKQHKPKSTFIIALDNPNSETEKKNGQKGLENALIIKKALDNIGVKCYIKQPYKNKDANEDLIENREMLKDNLLKAQEEIEQEHQAEIEQYKTNSVINHINTFISTIRQNADRQAVTTGYTALDKKLTGGLYEGLYVIGAISSLGKTTFCLNMADNIAKQGTDVIIFALEMAKDELIAKSISRETYINSQDKAKTTREILTGSFYKYYSQAEKDNIEKAISNYSQYAEHLYIYEGINSIGIDQITNTIEQHIKYTGNKPIVFIDYLQIVAPCDIRATDKQNTDRLVTDLKRLSRDKGITIIGISSFNRENYTEAVSEASFKESGAIEYTSDVLIGLQYKGMDRENNEADKEYKQRIRILRKDQEQQGARGNTQDIQLKVIKNRNGAKGGSIYLKFAPKYNYFYEDKETIEENVENTPFSPKGYKHTKPI